MGDMVKVFFEQIKELDGKVYISNYLRYQLSPLIHRVKPAMTININKHKPIGKYWDDYGEEVIDELSLSYALLRETETAKILIIYDAELIEKLMEEQRVKVFLSSLGYRSFRAGESIEYLIERYSMHHCPHELGVFLGIPLHDVEAFMGCEEKSCLMCGYWKVYSNLDYALDRFQKYDTAKEVMLKNLITELKGA